MTHRYMTAAAANVAAFAAGWNAIDGAYVWAAWFALLTVLMLVCIALEAYHGRRRW